jgi:transglutaminase-like putative cysteine protease
VTWRIGVEHTTDYRYAGVVRSSYNEARISPLTTIDQLVLDATVEVTPTARVFRYLDYWGSVVHAFNLSTPHEEMTVVARSVVQTSPPGDPAAAKGWPEMADPDLEDDFAELLAPTAKVPVGAALTDVAMELRGATTPATAGPRIIEWVRSQLDYVPGTTQVHTSALEAWAGGRGVCQDFAHLTLAVSRAMGIPGRYCSGYLHPDPTAGIGVTVAGQSHAWVELWTGEWQGFDPTSGDPIGERHVLVARGRDYSDVSPIKGVLNGAPTSSLTVNVNLTRLG